MCVLSLSEADYESVRSHGLGQPEIVELTAMSGLAVYANIMADATGMEADAVFGHTLAIVTQQLSGPAKSFQLPIVGFLTISAVS